MSDNAEFDTRYIKKKKDGKTTQVGSNEYVLIDSTRGQISTLDMNNSLDLNDAVNFTNTNYNRWLANEYNNTDKDNGALDAHYNMGVVYDYFKNFHNRLSFDGANAPITNYVHFAQPGYNNAFFDSVNQVFVYGDGNQRQFDTLVDRDIVVHEFAHAFTQSTSGLEFQNFSGAINEGISDIWSAIIEYYENIKEGIDPTTEIYQIGEDTDLRSSAKQSGWRIMSAPKMQTQPDTMGGVWWYDVDETITPAEYNDFGGVHKNSGVINYWFYLTSQGGTGTNDFEYAYDVTGIGVDKAAQIIYRTQILYMTSSMTFEAFRRATVRATSDIFGTTSLEVNTVNAAWDAVNVPVNESRLGRATSSQINNNCSGYTGPDGKTGPNGELIWWNCTGITGNTGPRFLPMLFGETGIDNAKLKCGYSDVQKVDIFKGKRTVENITKKKKKEKISKPIVIEKKPTVILKQPKQDPIKPVVVSPPKRKSRKPDLNTLPIINNPKIPKIKQKITETLKENNIALEDKKCNTIIGGNNSNTVARNTISIGHSQSESRQQDSYSIAIGVGAGDTQKDGCIAVGFQAGKENQGKNSVALGTASAFKNQDVHAIAIGFNSGFEMQSNEAISIGSYAGYKNQNEKSISLGVRSGYNLQGRNSIALGTDSGNYSQGENSIAIGYMAGFDSIGKDSIAIGYQSTTKGKEYNNTITIGKELNPDKSDSLYIKPIRNCDEDNNFASHGTLMYNNNNGEIMWTEDNVISPTGPRGKPGPVGPTGPVGISLAGPTGPRGPEGYSALYITGNYYNDTFKWNGRKWITGQSNTCLGKNSGYKDQQKNTVAIGEMAGWKEQKENSVSVGYGSGKITQGKNSVAIGYQSAEARQGEFATAVGYKAGSSDQGKNSVGIGAFANFIKSGDNSIGIGYKSNYENAGKNSICIGTNISRKSADNSILINASNQEKINVNNSGCYITPIRKVESESNLVQLYYNPETKEIVFKE